MVLGADLRREVSVSSVNVSNRPTVFVEVKAFEQIRDLVGSAPWVRNQLEHGWVRRSAREKSEHRPWLRVVSESGSDRCSVSALLMAQPPTEVRLES